ncbi:terminase, partial [Pauljensenia sp. UMB6358]|nr:terminase [Pauljensenia sp. UMB6358]
MLWTAHRSKTSGETFKSMQGIVNRPQLRRFVASIRRANGQEAIEFVNGSRVLFGAREQGFGRGFAEVDIEVYDEAQIL